MTPLPLAKADHFAARIRAELEPFCERIEIAGSIRRRRPFVNDVDVVVLPKPGKEQALRNRCAEKARRVVTDGPMTLVVILQNGLQVDIWIAQQPTADLLEKKPTNFGSLLICRTGSKEHNIHLIEHAKSLGLIWNPYYGVFRPLGIHLIEHAKSLGLIWNPYYGVFRPLGTRRSECIASATEEEIFAALQLDFIPPEKRER